MAELFANNAQGSLSASITALDNTLTLQTGEGAQFPSPTGGDFFRVFLFKKSTSEWEIALCTARSGDILSITSRAQEGTTALALAANDAVQLRPSAAFFQSLNVTSTNIQDNSFKKSTDTGVANAYEIAPNPVVAAYAVGQEFFFIPTNNNTGACTLRCNGLNPAQSIKMLDNSDPYPGALTAGRICHVYHDGLNFILLNPAEKSHYFPNVANPAAVSEVELDRLTDVAIPYDLRDANNNTVLGRGSVPGAVNYPVVVNAAAGNGPIIAPGGSDIDIDLTVKSEAAGDLKLESPSGRVLYQGVNLEATPAFRANIGSVYTHNSNDIVRFDAEVFDVTGDYDVTTYRFTPSVAGKYYCYVQLKVNAAASSSVTLVIRKNNAFVNYGLGYGLNTDYHPQTSGVIEFNGTTDYIDVVFAGPGTLGINTNDALSFFGAFRIQA